MSIRVTIRPHMINWAIERSEKSWDYFNNKFNKLDDWLQQTVQPTYKQAEDFAKVTFTSVPMLLMDEPPEEKLPIADFRSVNDRPVRPSANLLDIVHQCQVRQEWYREYCLKEGEKVLSFVGKFSIQNDVIKVANFINQTFELQASKFSSNQQAFSFRRDQIESKGVLIMSAGIVGSNTKRALNVDEFRGFALNDEIAPVIFINAKDSKSANSFTLIHELAHILLGESGVSNALDFSNDNKIEKWCNQVAGHTLMPKDNLLRAYNKNNNIIENAKDLANIYKVSTLVVLNRLKDCQIINDENFWNYFNQEQERIKQVMAEKAKSKKGGGNFYNSKKTAISKRFGYALTLSTLEGNTLYRDAMNMIGIKSNKSFNKLASQFHKWV